MHRRFPYAACRECVLAPPRRHARSSQASLPAEKYGSSGSPLRRRISAASASLSSASTVSRPLVLPDDDRRQRGAGLGVPREHRLALVIEAARDDLARGVGQQLRDDVDDRVEDLERVLLDPARLRVAARRRSGARLRSGRRSLVEERGLDGGRALVDAEDEARVMRRRSPGIARCAATRDRPRRDRAGADRARAAPPARAALRGRRRGRRARSAIPRAAVRPVERIAAACTSPGHGAECAIT